MNTFAVKGRYVGVLLQFGGSEGVCGLGHFGGFLVCFVSTTDHVFIAVMVETQKSIV